MITIYKYPLEITDTQNIELPIGCEILCVKEQDDKPVLYALVNTMYTKESTTIECYGTGHALEENFINYISTTMHRGGKLVLHWFVKI